MSTNSIAVIGTGYWGKNLVRNFYALGSLHTVCDTNPEILQSFVKKYSGVEGADSYAILHEAREVKLCK